MQWSDVTAVPDDTRLRQFAALCLALGSAAALWRTAHGHANTGTAAWAVLAAVGAIGIIRPRAIRYVYQGWMAAAFPVGWSTSRLALGAVYYLVVTPLAIAFRLSRRDALNLQARRLPSYWSPTDRRREAREYLRQS